MPLVSQSGEANATAGRDNNNNNIAKGSAARTSQWDKLLKMYMALHADLKNVRTALTAILLRAKQAQVNSQVQAHSNTNSNINNHLSTILSKINDLNPRSGLLEYQAVHQYIEMELGACEGICDVLDGILSNTNSNSNSNLAEPTLQLQRSHSKRRMQNWQHAMPIWKSK